MTIASVTVTSGDGIQREELRDIIAKALDDKGFAVTVVEETGGYEINPQRMKIYGTPGLGEPVHMLLDNARD